MDERTTIADLERRLTESETRHRLLIESWVQAVWETDAQGVVVADSLSWRAYTGQALEEWLGYGWLDAIHPEDRAYAERQWRTAVAAHGLVNAEFRLRAPDGGWRWTNVRAAPVFDAGGNIEKWAGMNIDIDASKGAEARLRESEERYRTVFEVIDEGFCVVEPIHDADGNATDYRIIEVNPAFERQTGLTDVTGRLDSEIAGTEPRWIELYAEVARTGESRRLQDYHEPTGRWYDVHVGRLGDTTKPRVSIVFTDITARKKAETALRESEERQAFLLKLSDAIRPLADAVEIQSTTTRLLGTQLNLDRAMYAEVDGEPGNESGTIRGQYVRPANGGLPSVTPFPERFAYRPYGERTMPGRYRGDLLVVADIDAVPGFDVCERAAWAAANVRAAIVAPLVKGGRLVAEFGVHSAMPRAWTDHELSLVREVAERTWAAAERARAEAAMRAGEERLRMFGDASSDVLWIRDAETLRWIYLTPAFETIYGLDRDTALRGDNITGWLDLIVPEDRQTALDAIESVRMGQRVAFEYRIRRPGDGAVRWVRNTDFPMRDAAGRVCWLGGVGRDITEEKVSAQRQEVLVNELQHRARNLLGVVSAVASRTMKQGGAVEAFEERLQALSRAQGLLSQQGSDTVEVGALVRAELAAHAQEGSVRVRVGGPEVKLTARQVQNFALALHELTTNAVKYGALKDDHGWLSVTWDEVQDRRGRTRLTLSWTESGVAVGPQAVTRRGYGTELIQEALAYVLEADVEYELSSDGVRCRIEMPVGQPE